MLKYKKYFGFTISELLMALGIIGIIAAMTVPAVIENLHKRTFVAQLKSIISEVQQIAQNQMALKGTKDLGSTDFSSTSKLFKDSNFIITKKCSAENAFADCWGSTKYKYINKSGEYEVTYKNSIVLKNGVILGYSIYKNQNITGQNEKTYGLFIVDINGLDKPNVVGRDLFKFYISEKGNIYPSTSPGSSTVSSCTTTGNIESCTDLIIKDGWQMNY